MEEDKEKITLEKVLEQLPSAWIDIFMRVFIVVMFVEVGYLIYKTTGMTSFLILNLQLIKILIVGIIYLFIAYLVVSLFIQYGIPYFEKRQEKRKKEFIKELSIEIKKELKSKK